MLACVRDLNLGIHSIKVIILRNAGRLGCRTRPVRREGRFVHALAVVHFTGVEPGVDQTFNNSQK